MGHSFQQSNLQISPFGLLQMNLLQYCPGKMELNLLQVRLRSHQHHREQQLQGQLGYHSLDRVLQSRLCILPGEHKVPSQLLCLWLVLAHQHSAQTHHQLYLLCVFHVHLHQLAAQVEVEFLHH